MSLFYYVSVWITLCQDCDTSLCCYHCVAGARLGTQSVLGLTLIWLDCSLEGLNTDRVRSGSLISKRMSALSYNLILADKNKIVYSSRITDFDKEMYFYSYCCIVYCYCRIWCGMSHNMTFGYGLVYLFFDYLFFHALVHSLVLKIIVDICFELLLLFELFNPHRYIYNFLILA